MPDDRGIPTGEDLAREETVAHMLRQSEERFRLLYEDAPLPYQSLDADANLVEVNRAWLDMLGYEHEEVIGRPLADFLAPGEEASFLERFATFRKFGEIHAVDFCLVAKDGAEVLVRVDGRVATDESGDFARSHCILQDVTEHRRMEAALRKSEERYRSIVDSSPMGMHTYHLEKDGHLLFVGANPAADRILGVDNTEFIGKTIEEAFPSLVETEVPEAYRQVIASGEEWKTSQIVYDEGEISGAFEVHAFRIGPKSMTALFLDITERERDQAKLLEYHDRLEQLLEERTQKLEEARSLAEAVTGVIGRAVDFRDPYTAGHQRRVAELVCQLAERLGLEEEFCERYRMAAEVHDIGKLAIPAEILSKPTSLSDAEYQIIYDHPAVGYEIIGSTEIDGLVGRTVLEHHERLDGSGYPHGLSGEDISLGARLLAVADVVEAMSSHRPYRPSLGVEAALDEVVKGRGTLYDPAAVDACLAAFEDGFAFSA